MSQNHSNRSETFRSALKGLAKQPVFLIAAAVLLLAAVSLNAATQFLKLHFKKLPVPLAHTLEDIPLRMDRWICVAREEISDDVEQELGTKLYVMRYYLNKDAVSRDELERFQGQTPKECTKLLAELKNQHHGKLDASIISFA